MDEEQKTIEISVKEREIKLQSLVYLVKPSKMTDLKQRFQKMQESQPPIVHEDDGTPFFPFPEWEKDARKLPSLGGMQ